jgi:Holliday junction resolvase RusA-like endonuclease
MMAVKRRETPRPATIPRKATTSSLKRSKAVKRSAPLTWADARVEVTTTGGWRFTLPVVTSANRLWRVGKGRAYKGKNAGGDARAAALLWRHVVPLAGDLSVAITWHRSQRSGDVDNRIKGTLDLLRGVAYRDDAAVARVSCERVDDGTPARLVVDVEHVWRETPNEEAR